MQVLAHCLMYLIDMRWTMYPSQMKIRNRCVSTQKKLPYYTVLRLVHISVGVCVERLTRFTIVDI